MVDIDFQRLGGLELTDVSIWDMPKRRSEPGKIRLTSFGDRRDRLLFAEAYNDPESGITVGNRVAKFPVCRGVLTYIGQEALQRDIDNVKAALKETGIRKGSLTLLHRVVAHVLLMNTTKPTKNFFTLVQILCVKSIRP